MESLYQLPTAIRPFDDDLYAPQTFDGYYDQDLYTNLGLPVDETSILSSIPMMFGDVPYQQVEFTTQPLLGVGWDLDWEAFDPSLMPLYPADLSSNTPYTPHTSSTPQKEPTVQQPVQSQPKSSPRSQLQKYPDLSYHGQHDNQDISVVQQFPQDHKGSGHDTTLVTTKPSTKATKRKNPSKSNEDMTAVKVSKPKILKFQAISTTPAPNPHTQEPLLTVFDSFTGPKVKRNCRSGFTEEGKKKVDAVRAVGACVQCRFRKRTCGTGQPCASCKKRSKGSGLGADLCIRESPFEDLTVTEYYPSSCRKRIVDFRADFSDINGPRRIITIDGRGHASRPLHLIVLEAKIKDLDEHNLEQLRRIANVNAITGTNPLPLPDTVSVLDPDVLSALDVEQWAVEYTYRFNQSQDTFSRTRILRDVYGKNNLAKTNGSSAGPPPPPPQAKIPNATSFLFGLRYVEQGLPHSGLVANAVKLVALNYVLSNGIQITSDPLESDDTENTIPTIKAQIDTKLFQSLHRNEKSLYENLQKLIFKSAGQLTRDAIVPVCLCMWLLLRLQCLRASHLMNLRPQNSPQPIFSTTSTTTSTTSANHQRHNLNLLISTFAALFRSSMPLLLDFEDPFNADLLGGNKELIATAKTLGLCIKGFKKRGYIRAWRNSKGYTKAEVARIRGLVKYD